MWIRLGGMGWKLEFPSLPHVQCAHLSHRKCTDSKSHDLDERMRMRTLFIQDLKLNWSYHGSKYTLKKSGIFMNYIDMS